MTLRFGNTKDLGGAIKAMCYAPAGYGKTKLCGTAPAPLVISAETGLLSLKKEQIPYIAVTSMEDFRLAYTWITTDPQAKAFQTICIDSITDIAESALDEFKKQFKDPRQAYGQLNDEMLPELKKWRDLENFNVYITCEQTTLKDEHLGTMLFSPGMPGKQLPQKMPYWGDELFALRIINNEDGTKSRWLQTQPDMQYYAKDRSGSLEPFEQPNLTTIFNKIKGDI